jgi:hypothetical protein
MQTKDHRLPASRPSSKAEGEAINHPIIGEFDPLFHHIRANRVSNLGLPPQAFAGGSPAARSNLLYSTTLRRTGYSVALGSGFESFLGHSPFARRAWSAISPAAHRKGRMRLARAATGP